MKITDHTRRLDSKDKLCGEAKYIEDIQMEGMLYARTLRSSIPCGRIIAVEQPPVPPGITIVDWRDVMAANGVSMIQKDMPIFAKDLVTYLGEPIALIVGESKDATIGYMASMKVSYEEIPGVYTLEEASEKAESDPSWILSSHRYGRGELDSLAAECDFIHEGVYETGYQEQLYMEKQGMMAYFEGDVLTVIGSMQCPYYIVGALEYATGLDRDHIRVIQSETGGAFGGKEEYPSLLACQVAMAAKKTGQPVQLVFDRREDMAFTTKRHPSKSRLSSYVKDGRIIGMRYHIDLDAGSYIGLSDVVLQRAILTMTGCYHIENLEIGGRCLKTNNVFTGAFRGFGAPQSMFALELHMSEIAKRLNVDPLAFRQSHFVHQGDTTSTGGRFNEPIRLEEMTDRLLQISKYKQSMESMKDNGAKKNNGKEHSLIGYGFAIIPHGGGFTGDGEATHIKAMVKLKWDRENDQDRFTVLVSSVEMGQGAKTALSKIVASTLEVPIEAISFHPQDTAHVPDSGPTVASRTTMVVGGLLHKAALRLKGQLGDGYSGPLVIEEHFKQPEYVKWHQETLTGNAYMAYSWAAILARVHVDPTTYEVDCTDIWGVYDVGIPIDEALLIGQVHGGIAQGIGYALLEHMTSTAGHIDQNSFSSYPIPTIKDMPNIHTDWLINKYVDGPFGAKAAGELTLVGVAPAVASAVLDAIGHSIRSIPILPETILEVLT